MPGTIETLAVLAVVLPFGAFYLWAVYEVLTMPPDDERWEIIAETQTHDTIDYWWGK